MLDWSVEVSKTCVFVQYAASEELIDQGVICVGEFYAKPVAEGFAQFLHNILVRCAENELFKELVFLGAFEAATQEAMLVWQLAKAKMN